MHESDPANAYYATGYAFALAQSDRAEEAVEVAEQLTATDRALPERTPYLAFVYASAMRPTMVDQLVANAEGFPNFLPEESRLLQEARDMVR